jgi:hypothetical protein
VSAACRRHHIAAFRADNPRQTGGRRFGSSRKGPLAAHPKSEAQPPLSHFRFLIAYFAFSMPLDNPAHPFIYCDGARVFAEAKRQVRRQFPAFLLASWFLWLLASFFSLSDSQIFSVFFGLSGSFGQKTFSMRTHRRISQVLQA